MISAAVPSNPGELTKRPLSQTLWTDERPRSTPAPKNAAALTANMTRKSEPTNAARMDVPTTRTIAARPASRSRTAVRAADLRGAAPSRLAKFASMTVLPSAG